MSKEAMKLALEALEYIHEGANNQGPHTGISWRCVAVKAEPAITAIKQALAAPVQEPVAGKGKELSEQLKLCARNVAFVAAGRVDMSSAAMQEMFALIDHVCVGLDSPPAQPAPAQEGRDWSLLEATQESLREHMAEIKRLKEAQAAPVQEPLSELEKDAANLLFALHDAWPYVHGRCTIESKKKAIQALMIKHGDFADLHPPAAQRQWVGLTDEDIIKCTPTWGGTVEDVARAIEAKLKEKNT